MWVLTSLLSCVNLTSAFVFFLVFLIGYHYLSTPSNLPPGPPGLPIVGNMFSMSISNLIDQFHKWHIQYGDVFTLKMGSKYLIVMNSQKLTHEAFVKNAETFSGRPKNLHTVQEVIKVSGTGVILAEGAMWKALRRVTLMTLRDFGVGKKSLEERVQDEARAIIEVIDKSQGQPINLKPLMSKFTANIICSVILGNRFEYEDAKFIELTTRINDAVRQPIIFNPANFISITRFVPSIRKAIDVVLDTFIAIDKHIDRILKDRPETCDDNEIRDFVDLYIKTRSDSEDAHHYDATNMRRVIIDLFTAGTETSSSTLDWITLFLVAHPDVQKRCQSCIEEVVGQHREISMDDRKNLPYIDAVISEVMRIRTIAPTGVPHAATKAGQIGGYDIPAESIVVANIMEIHMDPSVWSEPNEFKPQRFLDEDGKLCSHKENFFPFSVGPRMCLGEVLARMEVFLLLTTLLQKFTFTSPQGQKPDLEGHLGITFTANLQPVVATRR